MRRELGVLFFVFILSLVPTYWASLPFDPKTADQIPLFSLEDLAWKQIWLTAPNQKVRVFKEGEYLWAEHVTPKEVERFRITQTADADILKLLSPLRIERDLGILAGESLDEYGLKNSTIQLEIELKNGERQPIYDVGQRNFGTRFYFIRHIQSGKVYLIDGTVVDLLGQSKARLFERRLVSEKVLEANKVEVSLPTKKGLQVFGLSKDGFNPEGEVSWQFQNKKDEAANTKANTWLDKISKIYAVKYVKLEPQTPPIFEVAYFIGDKPLDKIAFYKETVDGKPLYLARSHYSQVSVEVNQTRMAQIEGDVALVFP